MAFARRLAALRDWPFAAAEWTLPAGACVQSGTRRLELRGRIDALFADGADGAVPATCWVADFKTGNELPMSARNLAARLLKGNGIQVSLYALALAALGARDVRASLLTAETPVAPQVDLAELRDQMAFWEGLIRMQETGAFGMRGTVRSEYGASLALPLATLPVDPDVLEEKWALTHPALAAKEDDDEA